ncbi:MAG: molybdenum-dependent transcriptional regulator [Candidatus Dactylopiibacterium carminicum]|uniref:Molybdenum-dependent transcriptional regulator n=1 Tax=Candidatus Dactylopiibacterium carminicum TaxID=857335 RepID=A0A272EY31_9RHOO|nr:TOBE domain-containing protein [Candidatus Dactylopiibacterium carminicum]KAF7600402.1 molybdenum-dependent transcriptional regulator [Candidatus Dactylopiibacterium carminicum]PAS95023.1 MAG: molybdenum-dependent transcriptional regulator [Candidatus Dactylopiibacterium carminicum]PAS97868.1 MAG: molybdenum-dependent transcriptional regulator [Candidatus Dactylopiibacterium carminicum]
MNRSTRLIGRFGMDLAAGNFLGDTRIRLLEAIELTGSISQAAREVPLSYKAAWDAVDAMNNLSEAPLVERAVGGKHGGGTTLTAYGKRVVALYRAMEAEYQQALDRVAASLDNAEDSNPQTLRRLMRSVSITPSARNQFVGPVTTLRAGEVTFEVGIRFDGMNEIVAQISREGAEQLQLTLGRELHAWVNSSAVILMTDESLRISARNQLWGEVLRIHEGPVSVDVVLALPGGRTVSALITRESLQELGLREGSRACAVFKASSVMLCSFE